MSLDGILNVFKPAGMTSFAVVSLLRRLSGESRVGHAGTLDPAATGVLVICFGQGTRMIEFLAKARKTYLADIELGISTDTYDASGKVLHRGDASSVTREQAEQLLRTFLGSVEQIPPMHSALKYGGKRLYRLAREGVEVPRKPREVTFHRLQLLDWQSPTLSIEVECSAGTYIRSLAQDIGLALGCGAHLGRLVRTRSEPFHIDEATPLHLITEAACPRHWQHLLRPIDEILVGWEAVVLNEESEAMVLNGRSITLEDTQLSNMRVDRCRAYSSGGRFLAILRRVENDLWHPDKVFHSADSNEARSSGTQ